MGELGGVTERAKEELVFITPEEIVRLRHAVPDQVAQAEILADIFRVNTLSMIMCAGSGHVGTSFSALDIMTWLWLNELQNPNKLDELHSDIFFSSKGHDAPGLYSVLTGLGYLPFEKVRKLRRLDGLPGHPDVSTPYIVTNTGSLGMGISKARGIALAARMRGGSRRIFVLTGDGELQEGQIWESLQPTANGAFDEITVIVDHNKIQSDTWVKNVSDLGALEKKFAAFGWGVLRMNGHDMRSIANALAESKMISGKPRVIIADTVKGKGVSFMEQVAEDGWYKFHSGAPSKENYRVGVQEILNRIHTRLRALNISESVQTIFYTMPERMVPAKPQKLVGAYSTALMELAREREDIVAVDADLVLDTGLIPFKNEFPERYIEAGIAEQDMVSMAGALARNGFLPIVHSFACFLPTRANEHFYNNATERSKVIYCGSLAGVVPGSPGHSHQSVRDISILASIPGLTLVEPADEAQTRAVLRFAVRDARESVYIRLTSIPVDIPFPEQHTLPKVGHGMRVHGDGDVAILAYGPVMLSESWHAARLLYERGISVTLFNTPWLNEVSDEWIEELARFKHVVTVDNHYTKFGCGASIQAALGRRGGGPPVLMLGVKDIPACGTNAEVLKYHGLDAESIARQVEDWVGRKNDRNRQFPL